MNHPGRCIAIVVLLPALAAPAAPALASVLGDANQEIHLGVMADLADTGAPKAGSFEWGGLLGKGHNEIGVSYIGGQNEFDTPPFDKTVSLWGFLYAFNWTPDAARVTGFVSLSAGGAAPSVPYDRYGAFAVGAKILAARSIAVTLRVEEIEIRGKQGAGDRSTADVGVGVSFFTHRSP